MMFTVLLKNDKKYHYTTIENSYYTIVFINGRFNRHLFKDERTFHINLRKNAIKNNISVYNGSKIKYRSKYKINNFIKSC